MLAFSPLKKSVDFAEILLVGPEPTSVSVCQNMSLKTWGIVSSLYRGRDPPLVLEAFGHSVTLFWSVGAQFKRQKADVTFHFKGEKN